MAYPRCRVFKNLRRETGFALLEMILNILIMSIMVGVSATVLMSQVKVRTGIQYQGQTAADLNYAMRFIRDEIEHIEKDDLVDFSDTAFTYFNAGGEQVSLSLDVDGAEMALYRNGEVYLPDVEDFNIEYFHADGSPLNTLTDPISDVGRIKIEIVKYQDQVGVGLTYSALIIPREFIGYKDYE